jgi:predicted dehydrogenase
VFGLTPVKTALVGISGIGGYHLELLHSLETVELVAGCDKWPEREPVAAAAARLAEWEVPLFDDIWVMLDQTPVEMVVIATPHPYHAPYTLGCLERDLHVLCEKPLTVLAGDALRVAELSKARKRHVAVDFQFTSYKHSRQLKEVIGNGDLGELREIVGVMEWMRLDSYYERSDWSGKRYYDDLPCWDGVLMNQAVHLVNSALQMGTAAPGFAVPQRLQAEMYRVHDIECEDLATIRADLGEATLTLYATTCCEADYRTSLEIIGTKGRASWDMERTVVRVDGKDELVFEEPSDRDAIHKNLVACLRGLEHEVYAPASEALKATATINGAYASAGRIPRRTRDQVAGLRELMDAAAEERKLLAEMPGVDWGEVGEVVEQADFATFAGLEDD